MSEDFESPILDKLADRLTTILRRAYPTSLAVKELARANSADDGTVRGLVAHPGAGRHGRFEYQGAPFSRPAFSTGLDRRTVLDRRR